MWSRLPGGICSGKIGFLQSSFYEVMWNSLDFVQITCNQIIGLIALD